MTFSPLEVVAHAYRQQILQAVWGDERSASEIADRIPVTFGAVSQHLRILRDAGFVSVRRDGRYRYYRANRAALGPLADYLESLWTQQLSTLKSLAEAAERMPRTATRRTASARRRKPGPK